ncbi:hypothetical protein HZC32_00335 [Candidatus Woesearchaeota archaeon]|nr:hypothetical protein [Candidatus Woesearchaeota archaeon]
MNVQSHLESLKESVRELEEAVKKGLSFKQRSLGFHASAAAMDMLEIIFHEHNLVDPGFVVKHEWLNSPKKIKEKFPFDFPHKSEIISLASKIEAQRNKLCYGKRQSEEVLENLVKDFNSLKEIFTEVTGHEL